MGSYSTCRHLHLDSLTQHRVLKVHPVVAGVSGHWWCSHLWVIVNNAAVNMSAQVFARVPVFRLAINSEERMGDHKISF